MKTLGDHWTVVFPISRDPPEGGTLNFWFDLERQKWLWMFPISRDPPEGGTEVKHG